MRGCGRPEVAVENMAEAMEESDAGLRRVT